MRWPLRAVQRFRTARAAAASATTPSSSSDRCALSHPEPSLPTALSAHLQLSSVCNPLPAPAQAQCYEYFSQSQHLQPRFQSNTLVALQGVWFGVYPASGIELVELRYDASKGMLTGTKLTGNQYVRAGRVSWEVTQTTCRVVSSL